MEHTNDEQTLINRGMDLTASLPDITQDKANDQIRSIYEDIQKTLRVPIVNLIFRTLANYPDYLESAWKQLSPVFRTKKFEALADEIRVLAVPTFLPEFPGGGWDEYKDIDHIRSFNDTIYYVLPKLLLVAEAFYQATFAFGEEDRQPFAPSSEIPTGVADGTTNVQMVDPGNAGDKVKELYASIRKRHMHPFVSSYYRGLGNWPDFLEDVWNRLAMFVGSEQYVSQKEKLVEKSKENIHRLPLLKIETSSLDAEQQEVVKSILAAFRLKFIPDMLMDVALIKFMLDGKSAALHSRFMVTDV